MNRNEILQQLEVIFRDVFDNPAVSLSEQTNANHIDEWDSLSNIELIVAIEKQLRLKFTASEIEKWQCVGDMISCIENKL